jgi:adenylate cyclase
MAQSRQLAAIMFTDIVGYTALMGDDEQKAFEILRTNRLLQKPIIEKFNGRWVKELGDGILASFSTATDAVLCASEIQHICNGKNEYQLRIGIHLGEVMFENEDVFGDGVNIASRLQNLAPVGAIWVSDTVQKNVSNKKEINTKFIREEVLKNVKEPVRIYEIIAGMTTFSPNIFKEGVKTLPEKSIAVLPFVNMSSDPEQEYFSDGISEEIITILSQIPGLKVAGRTSSFAFKSKNEDLRRIGEKLSVHTVLEGSVRRSGNRIRITAQLANVVDGYHLWSEKFDRVLNDVFEVQDEIAAAIVKKLQVTLDGQPAELRSRDQTENIEAYQYYLKGRTLTYKRGRYLFEAKALFEQAIALDPEYALAYAGLADIYTMICYFGLLDPDELWPKAKHNAELAMKFGPGLAETQTCNATIALLHDWDYEKAKKMYLRALEINPGYEQARTWYGFFYLMCVCSKFEEGIRNCRLAVETNPLSSYALNNLAIALGMAVPASGPASPEGIALCRKAVDIEPDSYLANLTLAGAYTMNREADLALQYFGTGVSLSNRHSWALSFLAAAYSVFDMKEKALAIYDELRSRTTYVQPAVLAMVAASLGHDEEALQYAHSGVDKHDPFLILSEGISICNALRMVPGFAEVRKRMRLR